MLEFDEAQARMASAGTPPNITEVCPIRQARGRILAQTLFASLDLPPADNSAMDGYAIRLADYEPGKTLTVQQRCFAGVRPEPLQPGQCIRLFTGSLIPQGADTVVMQEDGAETAEGFTITVPPTLGAHIRRQGEDVATEAQLFAKGTLLGPAEIALLASQGYAEVHVYPKLQVGILTTGDELILPGQERSDENIYNSNGPMLAAMAESLGVEVVHVLHALDTTESLEIALSTLLNDCDVVLTVGGVSVGEKDLVKPAIEQAGGKLELWRVLMKPGKPVALAHVGSKPIVCLPGNPVSAFAVFTLLVTPLIRTMQGRATVIPEVQFGRLMADRPFEDKREEFLRVRAEFMADDQPSLRPHSQQGSGIISSLPWASGFARIPAGTRVDDGTTVRYYDLKHWLS